MSPCSSITQVWSWHGMAIQENDRRCVTRHVLVTVARQGVATLDGKNSTESEPQKNSVKNTCFDQSGIPKTLKNTRGLGGGADPKTLKNTCFWV